MLTRFIRPWLLGGMFLLLPNGTARDLAAGEPASQDKAAATATAAAPAAAPPHRTHAQTRGLRTYGFRVPRRRVLL